ncbi:hypothetical protein MKX01_031499 [Papaver californicum]|nr:hypothetical protein MKX01_031499 [Papaver californicum]
MDASNSIQATTLETQVGSSNQLSEPTSTPEAPRPPSTQNEDTINVVDEGKKKSKLTSAIWNNFTRLNPEEAECNYCKGKLAANTNRNGTSGLRKHLKRCPHNPNKKKVDGKETLMFPPPRPGEDGKLVSYCYSYDKLRRALVEFIVKDEMSFRMV